MEGARDDCGGDFFIKMPLQARYHLARGLVRKSKKQNFSRARAEI